MAARFYVTVHRHSRVVVPHLLTNVSVALVQLSEGKEGKFQPAERLNKSNPVLKIISLLRVKQIRFRGGETKAGNSLRSLLK